jgi:hypothetical protein
MTVREHPERQDHRGVPRHPRVLRERAEITKRLIEERGFRTIAVEAD